MLISALGLPSLGLSPNWEFTSSNNILYNVIGRLCNTIVHQFCNNFPLTREKMSTSSIKQKDWINNALAWDSQCSRKNLKRFSGDSESKFQINTKVIQTLYILSMTSIVLANTLANDYTITYNESREFKFTKNLKNLEKFWKVQKIWKLRISISMHYLLKILKILV